MKIAICLDDKNGMLFGGRRQTKDQYLRQQLLELAQPNALWMNGFSAKQFDATDAIRVTEDFLELAPQDHWCFVENTDVLPYKDKIRYIAIYRWNRLYPSDVKFPVEVFCDSWRLVSTRTFPGHSHDEITEEIYQL
jgi:hypothetical protein